MTAYDQLLDQLAARRPRVAVVLREAEHRRRANLADLLPGSRLAGLEELLNYLDQLAEAWRTDPALSGLAFLLPRLAADFETAVEATLSGYFAVAADALRDVMEIENHLLDFAVEPALVERWLTADRKTLLRDFQPAAVRARLHRAGVGRYRSGPEAPDYQAHSAALHVTPAARSNPFAAKGRIRKASFEGDAGFWEIFNHATRLLVALEQARLRLATDADRIPIGDLPAVRDAWTRTSEMQEAYLAILTAPTPDGRVGPAEHR